MWYANALHTGLKQEVCAGQHELQPKDESCIELERMQLLDSAAFYPMQLTTADAPESAVYLLLSCDVHVNTCMLN